MAKRIYLTTPFEEKDEAKLAGARWDNTKRKWWVMDDMDLAPFGKWLPDEIKQLNEIQEKKSLDEEFGKPPDNLPQLTVSQLLMGAAQAINEKYDKEVWLVGQIIKSRPVDYIDIELSDGEISTRASIRLLAWGKEATALKSKFIEDTDRELADGISIRVKIQAQFDPAYGFQGIIKQIDPSVTRGTIEERMREIRARLKEEQIWDKNKSLPAPKDFCRIACIHPKAASGYNDFSKDANDLERLGLLKVHYISATFEGNNAEQTLLEAFNKACTIHQDTPLDVLCLVRGGGSRGGLLNISTENLARAICISPMPVFVGIGHTEDKKLLLDEVAFKNLDTPSFVIEHIGNKIKYNADQAMQDLKELEKTAQRILQSHRSDTNRLNDSVSRDARQALVSSDRQSKDFRRDIMQFVRDVKGRWEKQQTDVETFQSTIKTFIPVIVKNNKRGLGDQIKDINTRASNVSTKVQNHIDSGLDTISISSKRLTDAAQKAVSGFKDQLDSGSKKHLNRSGEELDHFQELVQQMGPEKTMKRGYALPFDQHGKVIRNAKDTKPMDQIKLRFNDGTITVVRKE